MARGPRRYSPRKKFQVVLEVLDGDRSVAQISRAHGVHPNTILNWKEAFLERGAEIFETNSAGSDYEREIADLEQLLGKKEVEIALLKNFLGRGV